MAEPPRVDLRLGACFPYLGVENQGEQQACVAHSFAMGLYCLKADAELLTLPATGLLRPDVAALFGPAVSVSPDPARGVSFEAVLGELQRRHGADLRALGWRAAPLNNDVGEARRCLREGSPVVVGYQVNAAIARFHEEPEECRRHGYILPAYALDPVATSAHAVLVIGYDDRLRAFLARNSWGPRWGVDGHFLLPYAQFADASGATHTVGFVRDPT